MTIPVAEIITFSSSEAYRQNPATTLAPYKELLSQSSGKLRIFHGLCTEDPSEGYVIILWESVADREALKTSARSNAITGALANAVDGSLDAVHAQFPIDCTAALSAPVVEFVFINVKEGHTKDSVAHHLDTITGQEISTVTSATWGPTVERKDVLVVVVGWESLEAHKEAISDPSPAMKALMGELLERSTLKVTHSRLIAE